MGRDERAAMCPARGFGSRGDPNLLIMRSMVEGLSESVSPSTAFQAVPLPIAFGDREDYSAVR